MRRTISIAAVLWLVVSGNGICQPAPDAAALQALLAEFLAGASTNDPAAHERFWADSLVYTGSSGRRIGKAEILKDVKTLGAMLDDGFAWTHSDGHQLTGRELLARLQSGKLHYVRLETSGVTASVRGTTAIVRGDSLRQRDAIPESPGKADPEPRAIFYTLTLAQDGAAWKALALHSGRR
jgi:hypothetical protein